MDKVTKEDWIIMRLMMVALNQGGARDLNVAQTALYLREKYSLDVIGQCADAIRGGVR